MALPAAKSFLTVGAVAALLVVVFAFTLTPLTRVTDLGKDLAFNKKMLDAHLNSVMPYEDKVHFLSDGTLGRVREGDYWQPEFLLSESDVFYSLPRRNGIIEFRVYKIESDGVIIEYDAKARPRDRSQPATSVDHGLVHLAWKENDQHFAWPYPR